jgi:hypothetical protein
MRDGSRTLSFSTAPWALLAVAAALVFVAYVRLRVADVPLERDEGEYAYAGQLILQGVPPYELAYNMKFPGTYYAYAAILALFGQTPWGIHFGLMLVNAASIVLVFVIGRRLLGAFAGATASVGFAVLSLNRWLFGVFAHATHFVVLAVLVALWLLLRASDDRRSPWFFWSGVLLGVSVLMKQHAIFFLPFAAALVLWEDSRGNRRVDWSTTRTIGLMAIGAVVPLAVVVAVLFARGALGRFWFWTFHYARAYVSEVALSDAIPNFIQGFRLASHTNWPIWALGGVGLAALWSVGWDSRARVWVTGLLVVSFVSTCPGYYFRPHYFIVVLPAVALLCGVAVSALRDVFDRIFAIRRHGLCAVAVFTFTIGLYVVGERDYLFSIGARELSRSIYGHSPFNEAVDIGRYIRDHTDDNDRIAVLGSEPEIYFYADRKSTTGYIYTYALLEPQPFAKTMQDEMIREIERAYPKYLVFSWVDYSWMAKKDSDQSIIAWGKDYVHKCYDPVGVAEIVSEHVANVVWGEPEVRKYQAETSNLIYTFRRKSDAPCTVRN